MNPKTLSASPTGNLNNLGVHKTKVIMIISTERSGCCRVFAPILLFKCCFVFYEQSKTQETTKVVSHVILPLTKMLLPVKG